MKSQEKKYSTSLGRLSKVKRYSLLGVVALSSLAFAGLSDEIAKADEVANLTVTSNISNETTTTDVLSSETTAMSASDNTTTTETVDSETVGSNEATSVEGKVVEAVATAEISHSDTDANSSRATVTITTELSSQAKSGDYVDYALTNLPIGGLENQPVVTADNVEIGTVKVVETPTQYSLEQNNTLDNNGQHDQSLSTDDMDKKYLFRVVFNDKIEDLVDVKYSISYNNQYFNHYIATTDYSYVTSVAVNNKVLKTDIVSVPAYKKEAFDTDSFIESGFNTVRLSTDGSRLEDGKFAIELLNSSKEPVLAGSHITVDIANDALVTLTNNVGDVIKTNSQRGYYFDTAVNDNGIILNDYVETSFKVITNDGAKLTLEALDDIVLTNKFAIVLSANYTPSSDEISQDGTKIIGINNTRLTLTAKDGTLMDNTIDNDDTVNIIKTGVIAEAAYTGKLKVVHQAEDGTILETEPIKTAKENTSYITSAKTFSDYRLVTTPMNARGTYGRGTTVVIYIYKAITGQVIERNVTTSGLQIGSDIAVTNGFVKVNTAYDTSSQDEVITDSNGRKYQLVSKGSNSVGKVVEGTTVVVNIYKEITEPQVPQKPTPPKVPCPPVRIIKVYCPRIVYKQRPVRYRICYTPNYYRTSYNFRKTTVVYNRNGFC